MSGAPMRSAGGAPTTASGPGGSIYDLGYQGYEGPRLGRRSATVALFWHTIRSCFGIGRGGRAKIVPFSLAVLAILPAVVAVGFAALAAQIGHGVGELSPIRYDSYHGVVGIFIMLFCAAQAPELFGRDQRYGVLPLYFSRALTRVDYAGAKVGGLVLALFLVDVAPQVVLLLGQIFLAADPVTGIVHEAGAVPQFLLQGALVAALTSGLAAVIAAYTPRRAYATAAVIAIFIIPPIIVALIAGLASPDIARVAVLFSPGDIMSGTNAAIFGTVTDNPTIAAIDLPAWAYVAAAAVAIVGSLALTVRRYLRITT